MKRLIGLVVIVCCVVLAVLYGMERNSLRAVTLTSPHNTAMHNRVDIVLEKPAPVYIEYTETATGESFRTRTSAADTLHHLDLLLLKANTEYRYRVVIDNLFRQQSKELTFKTREQSPWLENHWFNENHPHDTTALGDGMILLCFGRLPGYMMLIDKEGEVRWYWQTDDIGVRAASITPRGTLLAMLRPFVKDVIDDNPMTPEEVRNDEHKKPMRRGSIGFAGGTGLAEVSLTGDLLWRIDMDKLHADEKDLQVIHHDVLMDQNHHIHTLYRPKKIATFPVDGKLVTDTLGGDGILVLDTLGNVLKRWSAWDVWDVAKDPYVAEYRYDRFHINGLCFDKDSNYLLSAPIEDQIWKVNKKGELEWRFGRAGDFEMDTAAYFSFQHAPLIMDNGDLMLFDNGLHQQRSGAKVFRLDEKNRKAETVMNVPMPADKYTSRMGNAQLLPNGNLLQCSSKTGSVVVTDPSGQVLWESVMYFAPYRAIYVPMTMFESYFTPID